MYKQKSCIQMPDVFVQLFGFVCGNRVFVTNLGGGLSRLLFETLQQLLVVSYFNLLLLKFKSKLKLSVYTCIKL